MNFPLTFVMLLMVAMASAVPKPKTYLVETAEKVTFQLFWMYTPCWFWVLGADLLKSLQ